MARKNSDKLWAGRFSKETDERVNAFNSSLSFDKKMWREDIYGSIAHVKMLGATGIISKNDAKKIKNELEKIHDNILYNELTFENSNAEDIHMFIEAELTKRIGEIGKKLHTARSRNDQVAVDLRIYLKNEIDGIENEVDKYIGVKHRLKQLLTLLCDKAEEYAETIMPGYTHLQRAQPITFGHHLMAYANMFMRDIERLKDAVKRMMRECPLGSCALAGSTFPIDREYTAKELEFYRPCANSLDGVSDRDYCIEILSSLSIVMVHLSRFAEEIILWCSWEFKFIELDDAFSTGSSIMPQKKNPDVAELVRGKSGRVFGDLQTLLTVMKGLPLAYNKDMQEDKEAIFDAIDTINLCLETFIPMLNTMKVNEKNMRAAAAKGFINATDCADYLVKKGMAFRTAYKITGELVARCIELNRDLESLPLKEYKKLSDLFEEDIHTAINLEACAFKRNSYGGPAPEQVKKHIRLTRERLKNSEENE